MSKGTLRILFAIHRLEERGEQAFGFSITEEAGVMGRTVYPDLARLENTKMIESDWISGPRPRRRIYWLTEMGKTQIEISDDPGPTWWRKVITFIKEWW